MNTKNHKIRIMIYMIVGLIITAVGVFLVLNSNSGKSKINLQDKLDLGHKYLVELSYDKAVLEFTDAIEIDPMNADAYLGLADAYIGQGDTDKAVEVLEKGFDKTGDDMIKEKLDELKPVEETTVTTVSENIAEPIKNEYVYMYIPNEAKSDYNNNFCLYDMKYPTYRVRADWSNGVNQYGIYYELLDRDSSSTLFQIFIPEKEDSIVNIDLSNGDVEIGKEFANSYRYEERVRDYKFKYVYDEDGICRESIAYRKDNGEIEFQIKYDDHGNIIDGFWTGESTTGNTHSESTSYTYNDNGRIIKKMSTLTWEFDDYTKHSTNTYECFYDSNQNMIKHIYTYKSERTDGSGDDGEYIGEYFYNSNNDLIKSISYSKGEEVNHVVYEYDENGNLITEIFTSAESGSEHRTEYSYMRVKVLRSEVEKLKEDYGVELKVFEIE